MSDDGAIGAVAEEQRKFYRFFGEIVKRKREALGLSQAQLAEVLGLSSQSIMNNLEHGKSNIQLERAVRMMKLLKINYTPLHDYVDVELEREMMADQMINLEKDLQEQLDALAVKQQQLEERRNLAYRIRTGKEIVKPGAKRLVAVQK
jgi:transcriptional regulator with XRE-family HTH domain